MKLVTLQIFLAAAVAYDIEPAGYEDAEKSQPQSSPISYSGGDQQAYNTDGQSAPSTGGIQTQPEGPPLSVGTGFHGPFIPAIPGTPGVEAIPVTEGGSEDVPATPGEGNLNFIPSIPGTPGVPAIPPGTVTQPEGPPLSGGTGFHGGPGVPSITVAECASEVAPVFIPANPGTPHRQTGFYPSRPPSVGSQVVPIALEDN